MLDAMLTETPGRTLIVAAEVDAGSCTSITDTWPSPPIESVSAWVGRPPDHRPAVRQRPVPPDQETRPAPPPEGAVLSVGAGHAALVGEVVQPPPMHSEPSMERTVSSSMISCAYGGIGFYYLCGWRGAFQGFRARIPRTRWWKPSSGW